MTKLFMVAIATLVVCLTCGRCSVARADFAGSTTADTNTAVITCDGMTKEDRVEVVTVGTLGVLLAVAAPKFSREVNICLWLAYLAFVYGLAVVKLRRKWWSRMSLVWVLVIGWGLASVASLAAWYGFPPEQPAQAPANTQSQELPLKYMAWSRVLTTANEGTRQEHPYVHIDAEFTNKSEKNMSLSFILMLKFKTKSGPLHTTSSLGRWKEKIPDEFTEVLNLPRESTVKGHLVFDLLRITDLREIYKDVELGADRWEDVKDVELAIRIEDKVSGVVVLSSDGHYPNNSDWLEKWKKDS